MIKFFQENIQKEADKIAYSEALPLKESVMFLQGTRYQTGSDYSDSILSTPIEDIEDAYYSNL